MGDAAVAGERHGGQVGFAGEVVVLGEGGAPFRVGQGPGAEALGLGGGCENEGGGGGWGEGGGVEGWRGAVGGTAVGAAGGHFQKGAVLLCFVLIGVSACDRGEVFLLFGLKADIRNVLVNGP